MNHRYEQHRPTETRGSRAHVAVRQEKGPGDWAGREPAFNGVPRYLREFPRAHRATGTPVTIQRDGDAPLPSSGFQLTPPSLLQPSDPYARYMPDFGLDLQLDPEVQAQIRVIMAARARELMNADHVIASVRPLLPAVPIPVAGGGGLPATAPIGPGGFPPTPSPGPGAASAPSYTPGPVRPGSGGDVLSAVVALPQVRSMLDGVKNDFTGGLSRYWDGASTFDRTAFVTGSVVVGASIIGPIVGFEGPRNFVLPRLNDVVIPIPGLSGYGLEMHFTPDAIMIGAHLDVGQFLPPLLNFGTASFQAIGGPPQPTPFFPISPMRDGSGATLEGSAGIAGRIARQSGGGTPLDPSTRRLFESETGQGLPDVRLHVDGEADRLSAALGARAFTAGRDIFFRAGTYAPDRPEGRRLLAHELAHVPQQERGIAAGRDVGHGVRVTEPGDVHEQEAERVAARLSNP